MVSSSTTEAIQPGAKWGQALTPTHDAARIFSQVCLSDDARLLSEHVRVIHGGLCALAVLEQVGRELAELEARKLEIDSADSVSEVASITYAQARVASALSSAARRVLDHTLVLGPWKAATPTD